MSCRSCDRLGLCQERKPHAFAPGVIDVGPPRRRWLWSDAAGALALVAAAYFLAGWLL